MTLYLTNRRKNFVGHTNGRLTVQSFLCSYKHHRRWICKCICGNLTTLSTRDLFRIKSCGCLVKDNKGRGKTTIPGESALHQLKLQYSYGAEKRNLEWSLTNNQFNSLVFDDCFYCGTPPSRVQKHYSTHGKASDEILTNGIDRIKNEIGYTIDNCVSSCKTCNYAKHKMSQEDFLNWISRLVSFNKDKNFYHSPSGNEHS